MKNLLPLYALVLLGGIACSDGGLELEQERSRSLIGPQPLAVDGGASNCGNSKIDPTEQCDGANLNKWTCKTIGYAGGILGCKKDCSFDMSKCSLTCGNGTVDTGEDCDGKAMGSKTCSSYGYNMGSLSCDEVTCKHRTSACSSHEWLSTSSQIKSDWKLVLDGKGGAYLGGTYWGTLTVGGKTLTAAGQTFFLIRLDKTGKVTWAKNLAPTGADGRLGDMIRDSAGTLYFTGAFKNKVTFGGTTLKAKGGSTDWDIFVAKTDGAGKVSWAISTGGASKNNGGNGIARGKGGELYVIGDFAGTAAFGGTSLTAMSGNDIFVARLTSAGVWSWARSLGSKSETKAFSKIDSGQEIAVEKSGDLIIFGTSGDFLRMEGKLIEPGGLTFAGGAFT